MLNFIFRNWIILGILLVGVYFYLQPEKKRIIVVDNNSYNVSQVTKDDSRIKNIWDDGGTFIINNSNRQLILESVSYSTTKNYSYNPTRYTIKGYTTYPTNSFISYLFIEPPNSISVQGGGTVTRWCLRYKSNNDNSINSSKKTTSLSKSSNNYKYRQCNATAKSTGKRCKRGVSSSSDYQCYQHKL